MNDSISTLTEMIEQHKNVVARLEELKLLPDSDMITVNDQIKGLVYQALQDRIISLEQSAYFIDKLEQIRNQISENLD